MARDGAKKPTVLTNPPTSTGAVGRHSSPNSKGGTYFLGRYRVVDEIGVGGMASVHLARMDGPGGFQKWVAIKRIHSHLVEDESFVNMFFDEARVAARISHPNVATVFELGKHEDTYWIAMEYLHGEPLREVMRRTEELGKPMDPEIACRVIADAAEGLHAAHELLGKNGEKLGLVHRDVTPHNLFVTYDGNTKVVDFGIAKFSSRMANTRAGTLKGKLAYMSPEQVAGEPIDRRTDIFALGVVLWELTTGQRLFRMESDIDTLAKVQECNVPRPSTLVRNYPMDLEKIVMKALAKNKNERFRTARELSRALQQLLMRRGMFVASDEVAAYCHAIFEDRIRKREAHLRWAAEVTQTISLDGASAAATEPWHREAESSISHSSDIQHPNGQAQRPAPRPAAGERARASSAAAAPANENRLPQARETVRPPGPSQAPATAAPRASRSMPPIPSSHRNARASIPAPYVGNQDEFYQTARVDTQALHTVDDQDPFDDSDDTIVTLGPIEDGQDSHSTTPVMPPPHHPGPSRTNIEEDFRALSLPPPPAVPTLDGARPGMNPGMGTVPGMGPNMAPAPGFASARPPLPAMAPATMPPMAGDAPSGSPPVVSPSARSIPTAPPTPLPMGESASVRRGDIKTVITNDTVSRHLRRFGPLNQTARAIALFVALASITAVGTLLLRRIFDAGKERAAEATTSPETGVDTSPAASALSLDPSPGPSPPESVPQPYPPGTAPEAPSPQPMPTLGLTSPSPGQSTPASSSPPRKKKEDATNDEPRRHRHGHGSSSRTPDPEAGEGLLTVICLPACDEVVDNGQSLGKSPIFKHPVPAGDHKLTLIRSEPPTTKVVNTTVKSGSSPTVVRQSL